MPIDSTEKVITTYFPAVTKVPFTFRRKRYEPMPLRVSPQIFRGFVCVEGCGGCCRHFTLDFLPDEVHPYPLKTREIQIDGRVVVIHSDLNDFSRVGLAMHHSYYCRHLNLENGRCGLHPNYPDKGYPFSCDFELLRFHMQRAHEPKVRPQNRLSHQLFGRGWAMLRVDGERGAKCYMTEVKKEHAKDVVRKLTRLKAWCEHFGIPHVVDGIIEWASTGPHIEPLYLNQQYGQNQRTISLDVIPDRAGRPARERLTE